MNSLLLYCILGASLCVPQIISETVPPGNETLTSPSSTSTNVKSETKPSGTVTGKTEVSISMTTRSATAVSQIKGSPSPGLKPDTTTNPFQSPFWRKECLQIVMVSGGLILACIILLISTLLLACKVCQLKGHIKALSSDSDLISSSGYWTGTGKKNKSKSEADAKETSVLMSDVSHTQNEMANGNTKEEGGPVEEAGQVGEENKKKEEGEAANSEEVSATPVTVAETPSNAKPQEEATDSKSTDAVTASSSEGTEEPKDVV